MLDFAWYLTVWMTILNQDEESFWSSGTPAKIMALFKAYRHINGLDRSATASSGGSLSQYLAGAGV